MYIYIYIESWLISEISIYLTPWHIQSIMYISQQSILLFFAANPRAAPYIFRFDKFDCISIYVDSMLFTFERNCTRFKKKTLRQNAVTIWSTNNNKCTIQIRLRTHKWNNIPRPHFRGNNRTLKSFNCVRCFPRRIHPYDLRFNMLRYGLPQTDFINISQST